MPPFLPRKRLRPPSPGLGAAKAQGTAQSSAFISTSPRRPNLFDALDASTSTKQSAEKTRNLLSKLAGSDLEESDLSSLSDSEPEFEDVPKPKRQKTRQIAASEEDDDEEIEFEDVHTQRAPSPANSFPSGDLDLTLTKESRISLTNPHNKKHGPSKIERQIRVSTHCMHVQFLLWHNWLRNRWLCDEKVQQALIGQLGPNIQKEIQRWRDDAGVLPRGPATEALKMKDGEKRSRKDDERSQRDWGKPAQRLVDRGINMSHGDPLFKLMIALVGYWKKRFRVIAPGLRKLGYMSLPVLDEVLKSFNKDPNDPEQHGERIRNVEELRACAKVCEGSRDLSAQLFTALVRAIGLEARMIVSLQPVGFGWSKIEEASEESKRRLAPGEASDSEDGDQPNHRQRTGSNLNTKTKSGRKSSTKSSTVEDKMRRGSRGKGLMAAPIELSDSENEPSRMDTDDESVIDVTPAASRRGLSKNYEKDLSPHYWIEVFSPVTNTYYPVNPFNLKNPVATNPELLAVFEPRGAKSERAKQVMAYIVGYSADDTAKDVTVRYLKRHMWPGKTKGFRIPVEKVPVYDNQGKLKHREEFDWFKTAMSRYVRDSKSRTGVDDQEEATDLKPIRPEKKEAKEGEETLQSYKSSPEFVLERHLRREEALLPTAQHVKTFVVKGKKGEPETRENVFLRKDVVNCKSVETWHKEGRAPIIGEQPLKRVPYRAATINRKRELAEAEAASGEKMLQGLYSWAQTDWIIPPPIVDGVIPKNSYGNMDVFVPSMVPEGAAHIPRRRTKEICRKLGIDYAEAVTGFEFGARMAIPIISGIVVAEENVEMILEQWNRDEVERARKEDEKRTKAAIGTWRKFLMGLRIVERVREEYGDEIDDNPDVLNPWTNKRGKVESTKRREEETRKRIREDHDEEMAGGFLLEGHGEEEPDQSFFPIRHDNDDDGGGFVLEHDRTYKNQDKGASASATPTSMLSNKRTHFGVTEDSDKEEERPVVCKHTRKLAKSASSSKRSADSQTQSKRPTSSTKGKGLAANPTGPKLRSSTSRNEREQSTPSDDDDDADILSHSSLSSVAENSESEPEAKAERRHLNRRSTLSKKKSASVNYGQRAVPKRQAARKSATALKSHYFADRNGDGDMDVDE